MCIAVGNKFGCLTVLDDGSEYSSMSDYIRLVDSQTVVREELEYLSTVDVNSIRVDNWERYIEFLKSVDIVCNNYRYVSNPVVSDEGLKIVPFLCSELLFDNNVFTRDRFLNQCVYSAGCIVACSKNDESLKGAISFRCKFLNAMLKLLEFRLVPHYKCICECGRVHYYSEDTLLSRPKFCVYPVSARMTRSGHLGTSSRAKLDKYGRLECVLFVNKAELRERDVYCDLYNVYRRKEESKKVVKLEKQRESYPHIKSKYYTSAPRGVHETLEFVERLEDKEELHLDLGNRGAERGGSYITYAVYKYRCRLCGKEFILNDVDACTKLCVHERTGYGEHAYNGYWSELYCDCHPISSFQWTVVDIFERNNISYMAEARFIVLGDLRFDFCVYSDVSRKDILCLIECQGEQHFTSIQKFGGESALITQRINDERKRKFCQSHGITLIEIQRQKRGQYQYIETILRDNGILN